MSADVRHCILATAGHVDHGKSSLVRALTGTDPDRLPEEKARGMTIDLGFAHLDLSVPSPVRFASLSGHPLPEGERAHAQPPGEGAAQVLRLGIIDVPGHEDFVKNMVAGVGSIDLVLLVVAADDGWMPQTEEHLQILSYLGVRRGVVAITKIDRAGDESAVTQRIREQLGGTFLEGAPVVATSILSGRGLDELREAMAGVASDAPPQRDIAKPRLPVDRAFSLAGVGTVVTGTLGGGCIRAGQEVRVMPQGAAARVRGVQSYGETVEMARPGSRVALNLAGLRAGREPGETGGAGRGDIVAQSGEASETLDVAVWRLARQDARKSADPRGQRESPLLRNGLRVLVHHGSAMIGARLMLAEHTPAPGARAIGQLRLEQPIFAFAGDRFVIRDSSGRQTLAGGIVLDMRASRRNWRRAHRIQLLLARADAPADPLVWVRTEIAARQIAPVEGLLRQSRFSEGEIACAVTSATASFASSATVSSCEPVRIDSPPSTASASPEVEAFASPAAVLRHGLLIDADIWKAALMKVTAAIDRFHRENPQLPGMPVSRVTDLLAGVAPARSSDELARAVIDDLLARGTHTRAAGAIRSRDHAPSLPPRLQAAGLRIRNGLAADPLNPPSRRQLAPDRDSEQALRFLISTGEVIELSPDCILAADAFLRAVEIIRANLAGGRAAPVSQLKQALGSSRRIVVPLLERLDQQGVTKRDGDLRGLAGS